VSVIDKSKEINNPIAPIDGNCFFKCHQNSRAWQGVNIQRFSLLIDSGQGGYNLSAHFGCLPANRTDQVYVRIDYATEEDVDVNSSTISNNEMCFLLLYKIPFLFIFRIEPGSITFSF
jgi:hypothetical protein